MSPRRDGRGRLRAASREIAALRREPVGTVKGRLRLGLKKLSGNPAVVACR